MFVDCVTTLFSTCVGCVYYVHILVCEFNVCNADLSGQPSARRRARQVTSSEGAIKPLQGSESYHNLIDIQAE